MPGSSNFRSLVYNEQSAGVNGLRFELLILRVDQEVLKDLLVPVFPPCSSFSFCAFVVPPACCFIQHQNEQRHQTFNSTYIDTNNEVESFYKCMILE